MRIAPVCYAVVVGIVLSSAACKEEEGDNDAMAAKVARLSLENEALRNRMQALETQIAALTPTVETAQILLSVVTVNTDGDVVIEGANLHVRNGTGFTHTSDNSGNGKGNIIIGYNEPSLEIPGGGLRTGSHYLIVGPGHSYSGNSGILSGNDNTSSADGTAILGGVYNSVENNGNVIVGGVRNIASGSYSTAVGGWRNRATGSTAVTTGGIDNIASGSESVVGGGSANEASGYLSVVSGGSNNTTTSEHATIGGGSNLTDDGVGSFKPTAP